MISKISLLPCSESAAIDGFCPLPFSLSCMFRDWAMSAFKVKASPDSPLSRHLLVYRKKKGKWVYFQYMSIYTIISIEVNIKLKKSTSHFTSISKMLWKLENWQEKLMTVIMETHINYISNLHKAQITGFSQWHTWSASIFICTNWLRRTINSSSYFFFWRISSSRFFRSLKISASPSAYYTTWKMVKFSYSKAKDITIIFLLPTLKLRNI